MNAIGVDAENKGVQPLFGGYRAAERGADGRSF